MRSHAWNIESRSGLSGARSIRRSSLSTQASAFITGRLAWPPRGPSQSRRSDSARGLCERWLEADSCPHGQCSPERAQVVRSGQPRTGALSWKRAELGPGGLARAVRPKSTADRGLEATSATTDQVVLEALGLLQRAGHPKMSRAETAPGLDKPGSAVFRSRLARRLAGSTPEVTRRHEDQCAFSTLPREHPTGFLRWPLAHLATLGPSKLGLSRPQRVGVAGLRRDQVCHCRRSDTPARGRVARERASLRPRDWTCRSGSQLLTGVSGAHRSGRGTTRSVN
jgi:hypothetical protein